MYTLLFAAFGMSAAFAQVGFDPAFPEEDSSVYQKKKTKKRKTLFGKSEKPEIPIEEEEPEELEFLEDLESSEQTEQVIQNSDEVARDKPGETIVNEPKSSVIDSAKLLAVDSTLMQGPKPSSDGKRYIKTTNIFGFETIVVADENNPAPEPRNTPVTSQDIAEDTYLKFPDQERQPSQRTKVSAPSLANDEKVRKFQYDTDVLIPDDKPGGDAVLGTSLLAPGETIEELLGEAPQTPATEATEPASNPSPIDTHTPSIKQPAFEDASTSSTEEKPSSSAPVQETMVEEVAEEFDNAITNVDAAAEKEELSVEPSAPTVDVKLEVPPAEEEVESQAFDSIDPAFELAEEEEQKEELQPTIEQKAQKIKQELKPVIAVDPPALEELPTLMEVPRPALSEEHSDVDQPTKTDKFDFGDTSILVPDKVYDAKPAVDDPVIESPKVEKQPQSKFDYGETQVLVPDEVYDAKKPESAKEGLEETNDAPENKANKFDFGDTEVMIPDEVFDAKAPVEEAKPSEPIAQPDRSPTPPPATVAKTENLFEPQFQMEFNAKKLINDHESQQLFSKEDKPMYPADVYRQRIDMIPSSIELRYDENVKRYINKYVYSNRKQLEKILGRRDAYFPLIESAFIKHGVPTELKYLAVIESGLNPRLNSSNLGTSGLWQLSVENARRFGLDLNSFIDERMDPFLSTDAMARYLKFLHQSFNDWRLVILAYGSGQGELIKAMQRAEDPKDVDRLAVDLPNRDYLSLFTAAMYAMHYYPEHNLKPGNPPFGYYGTDTIVVRKETDLREISRFVGMPLTEVQYLNPAVMDNIIPKSISGYPIHLPLDKIALFARSKDSIQGNVVNDPKPKKKSENKVTDISYTVRNGEKMGAIADKFGCKIEDIKRWNKLQSEMVIEGEILKVFVPLNDFEHYYNISKQ